jgi:hypothetical protein
VLYLTPPFYPNFGKEHILDNGLKIPYIVYVVYIQERHKLHKTGQLGNSLSSAIKASLAAMGVGILPNQIYPIALTGSF